MPFLPISHRFVIENWWFYFKHEHLFFSTEILRFPFSPFHFKGLTGRIMKRILNALIYVPQIQLRFWHMTMIDIIFFPSSFGREYFPLGPFAMAIGWKVKRYFAASISRIYQIVGLFCWHRWWCHWASYSYSYCYCCWNLSMKF